MLVIIYDNRDIRNWLESSQLSTQVDSRGTSSWEQAGDQHVGLRACTLFIWHRMGGSQVRMVVVTFVYHLVIRSSAAGNWLLALMVINIDWRWVRSEFEPIEGVQDCLGEDWKAHPFHRPLWLFVNRIVIQSWVVIAAMISLVLADIQVKLPDLNRVDVKLVEDWGLVVRSFFLGLVFLRVLVH